MYLRWVCTRAVTWNELSVVQAIQPLSNTKSFCSTAQLIRAIWVITRSFFKRVPEPKPLRIMASAVQRQSRFSLRMDVHLLAKLLYGDDANQATQDELLVRIKHTTMGQLQTYFGLLLSCRA